MKCPRCQHENLPSMKFCGECGARLAAVCSACGAPLAVEEHALRAVQAALAIQETIGGLSEEQRAKRGIEIRLRVGLNTGVVVVGRIGDDLRMDYTAIGETTHLAARLQASAEPGSILAGDATHRLV